VLQLKPKTLLRDIARLQSAAITGSSKGRIPRPPKNRKEFDMTVLARKFNDTLDILIPSRRIPDPANDNFRTQDLADYVARSRREAGADYQSAGSKMWWLP
jgi:hypothetical protein